MSRNEFLECERETVLRYSYYLLKAGHGPIWVALDSFLRQHHTLAQPPHSTGAKEIVLLFLDNSESIAIIDKMFQQDFDLVQLCPHERYKESLGSVFVIRECCWESLGRFLDFLAGVINLHPHIYEQVTPLVMRNHLELSFTSDFNKL